MIRSYGVEGLQAMIREHVALAGELASWVGRTPDFEVWRRCPSGWCAFATAAGGAERASWIGSTSGCWQRVNATGRVFLTHTRLEGRYTIRLVVGQRATERRHVEEAWGLLARRRRGSY